MNRLPGSRMLHYKNQRDKLGYYLIDVLGISRARVGRILGITRQAVDLQFPSKKDLGLSK